jgi:hypothetical protein
MCVVREMWIYKKLERVKGIKYESEIYIFYKREVCYIVYYIRG